MKILIALGNITPTEDANTNIAKLIAQELYRQHHSVIMLGTTFSKSTEQTEIDGIKYERIVRVFSQHEVKCQETYNDLKKTSDRVRFFIRHPIYFCNLVFRFFRSKIYDYRKKTYCKAFKRIIRKNKIDRVIVITSPFYVAQAAIESITNIPVVWYQLDPHSSNITIAYHANKNLLSEERELYSKVCYAVIPQLIYHENIKGDLAIFANKMIPSHFPNVRKLVAKETTDDIKFSKKFINVVFIGNFYEDIRNPNWLLSLFFHINAPDIILHIIGGGCVKTINEYVNKANGRILFHGYHSLQSSLNAMQNANILINLDNTARNMLPSKINDYISSGKAILNFHPYPDSESIHYLKKYPLCYNINTSIPITDELIKCILFFCREHQDKEIDFNTIQDIYAKSTPNYVANLLMTKGL